jgi:PAS domain S-box-containing protein
MNIPVRFLLVDHDATDRALITRELKRVFSNLLLTQITDANGFHSSLEEDCFDLVITKYDLRWSNGLSILRTVKAHAPECPVIMAINPGEEEIAVEAMRAGLDDFVINTPQHIACLGGVVRLALERSHQRKRLLLTETHLSRVIESAPQGFYRISDDWKLVSCNPAFADLLQIDSLKGLERPDFSSFLPQSVDWAAFRDQLAEQTGIEIVDIPFLRSDGEVINSRNHFWPILDGDEKVVYYEGWVDCILLEQVEGSSPVDETREQQPEQGSPQPRERILEAIAEMAGIFGKSDPWSGRIQDILGMLGEAALVNRVTLFLNNPEDWQEPGPDFQFTWPDVGAASSSKFSTAEIHFDSPELVQIRQELEKGKEFVGDLNDMPSSIQEIYQPHGIQSILWIPVFSSGEWWGTLGFGDHRQPPRWTAGSIQALRMAADSLGAAVQRGRLESSLVSAETQFRNLVEKALVGIYVLDQEGKFLYVNPKFGEIAGYSPEEIVPSMSLLDFIVPFDLQPIQDYINSTSPDDKVNLHFNTRAFKKGQFPIEIEVQGSRVDFNGIPAIIGTILDVSERRAREREMETIISISSILRSATLRSEILPLILDQVVDQVHVEGALLILRDLNSGDLIVELGRGGWAGATGFRMKPGEEWIANVISTGEPYIHPDVRGGSSVTSAGLMNGLFSVVGVPLIAQQQTLGSLWVGSIVPSAESTVRLVTAIGEIAANAIYRTSLHEQTELRLQRLTALRAIDMAITASLDVRVTLSILLSQVTAQLAIDAAGVMLLNPHTQMLEYSAVRGFRSTAIQHVQQRLGEGHAGLVAIDRQPVAIHNLKEAVGCAAKGLINNEGFETYFAVPLIAKGQVKGVLELFHRRPFTPDPEWMDFLQAVAAQAAIAIDNTELFDKLQRSNIEITMAYDATIEGLAHAMELREKEKEGHIQGLIDQTIRLARAAGIGESEIIHLRRGVLLHDIGHMTIPDSILFKPGPLDSGEWEVMHRHPLYAYELLSPVPYLRSALDIPYCHHERWDGTGYPRRLKGLQIPLAGRIFSLVDVWDAIQSERPYRRALNRDSAVKYLQDQSGKHFDPQLVDIFLSIISET